MGCRIAPLNVTFQCLYYAIKIIYFGDFVDLVRYFSSELSPNKHEYLMVFYIKITYLYAHSSLLVHVSTPIVTKVSKVAL